MLLIAVAAILIVCGEMEWVKGKRAFTWKRYHSDPSYFLSIFNLLMEPHPVPIVDMESPESPYKDTSLMLRHNWKMIRDEALAMDHDFENTSKNEPMFTKRLTDDGKWSRFYIKWYYGTFDPLAQERLPKTCALLRALPEVQIALLSYVAPGAVIKPHVGISRECIRVHLCLKSAEGAYIEVDGERYFWKEGEIFGFDDTFIHSVENKSETESRLILFLGIARDCKTDIGKIVQKMAFFLGKTILGKGKTNSITS